MSKNYKLYLEDILDSINAINSYTKNLTYEDFSSDRKTYSATIRELEIIGEAVGKLPDEIRNQQPDVEWRDIKGMRNLLIHEYFGVDLEIVWKVVKNDIPALEQTVQSISKQENKNDMTTDRSDFQ